MLAVKVRLYSIPGSHPSLAAQLMLKRKGVEYKRTDLISPFHRPVLRAVGFSGVTVPAIKADGRKVQGTRAVAEWLDEVRPEPPLVPADPERRRAVDEAERWGDQELQPRARRITWWAMKRDRSGVESFMYDARLGLPVSVVAKTAAPAIWAAAKANNVTEQGVRTDLEALPGLFDQVDALLAEGVIGGDELNVADYQIATSVRLLMAFDDLRASLEARPAGKHALRVVPEFPARVPPVFDAEARAAALGASS
jgi:glutathione S-transferase